MPNARKMSARHKKTSTGGNEADFKKVYISHNVIINIKVMSLPDHHWHLCHAAEGEQQADALNHEQDGRVLQGILRMTKRLNFWVLDELRKSIFRSTFPFQTKHCHALNLISPISQSSRTTWILSSSLRRSSSTSRWRNGPSATA
jgi:hypothetical protein